MSKIRLRAGEAMSEDWKVVHGLLTGCCQALFEGVGLTLTVIGKDASPARSGERLAAFIGFSGDEMRGAITLDLPSALVAQVHPSASARALDKDDLCDWAGELANQLLGRLKNSLTCYSVLLQLSTPSCVWGRMSHGTKLPPQGSVELHFSTGTDLLIVYFDAKLLKPIDFANPISGAGGEQQSEGDALFF